ncbi:MAG TPA: cupin domain-containing protein [Actinomycetes bacterium]|nr:cupin domain-containing protein [Actinomycetes bacterium]
MFTVTLAAEAARYENFRTVLHTGKHTQVVAMTLQPGEDIGAEVHPDNDQVLVFTDGTARAEVAGETRELSAGDLVVVPAGTEHNFTNTGSGKLRLITIYGPPDHAPDTVHKTKAEAEEAEAHGEDEPQLD